MLDLVDHEGHEVRRVDWVSGATQVMPAQMVGASGPNFNIGILEGYRGR